MPAHTGERVSGFCQISKGSKSLEEAASLLAEEGEACAVNLCKPRQGGGGAPSPRAARNTETEEGKPTSHLPLLMEELGQDL